MHFKDLAEPRNWQPSHPWLARISLAGLFFWPLFAFGAAGETQQQKALLPAAAGAKCEECHEETKSFRNSVHGKAARFIAGSRASSCDSCHGDVSKHLDAPDSGNIQNPAKMDNASDVCLSCHSRDQKRMMWHGSQHSNRNMTCLSCHSVHRTGSSEKMLAKRTEEELCLSCHSDQRKALFQRSTHLIRSEYREMKVRCSSCHNPHGGEGGKQLLARSANDLCFSCHAEKRGPFLWEHAPARENCLTCHTPHGSNHPKLLIARTNLLCQQCHIQGRHQTIPGRPEAMFTINRSCLNCHSQVHGSNHPSGVIFQR